MYPPPDMPTDIQCHHTQCRSVRCDTDLLTRKNAEERHFLLRRCTACATLVYRYYPYVRTSVGRRSHHARSYASSDNIPQRGEVTCTCEATEKGSCGVV